VVQNLGQGSIPGGKVVAAQKALAQPRTKTAPHAEVMPKSAFTLTRQAGQVWKSYYYAGAARIAMREENDEGSEVYYILTDHLGSTSITVNDAGQRTAQMWYKPWGETREVWGVLPTDRTFQGRLDHTYINMLWYGSRWYDPALGRFNQPDVIIPEPYNSLAYDRYQFVYSNPIKYIDPDGHCPWCVVATVIIIATLMQSCSAPATQPPPIDSVIQYETSWREPTSTGYKEITTAGLATVVGDTQAVSHDHFLNPPENAYDIYTTYSDSSGNLLGQTSGSVDIAWSSDGTSLINLPGGFDVPIAPIGNPTLVQAGDTVQVGYSENGQVNYQDFEISSIDDTNGFLNFNPGAHPIVPGDSGGPIFYNGQLIGNTNNQWVIPQGGFSAAPIPKKMPTPK
jgi:RHS repeat-associated protein